MLIVSKVLLARRNEHGAWQLDENKKRTPNDYVVVQGDDLMTVAKSVVTTALNLDLGAYVSDILRLLKQWATVSEEEDKVWVTTKAANGPSSGVRSSARVA